MFSFNEKLNEIRACLDRAENLLKEIENLAIPEQRKAIDEMLNRKWQLEVRNRKLKWETLECLMRIVGRMSIPMNEIGKDKFDFLTMGIGYKMTSATLREEGREVHVKEYEPIPDEFTPFLGEIFEHVLLQVSKKLDEIPEEVEQEIAKIASWTDPLKKQMAPLEKKICKAK